MEQKRDFSLINCFSSAMVVYFLTIPLHEMFHALTYIAYGDKLRVFSAGATDSMGLIDRGSLPYFHRVMLAGGSASILNVIIGIVLMIIVLKASMGPTLRVFLIQLMGAQLSEGIGYFMIGGFFGAGDWGNVFSFFPDDKGFVTVLRIVLSLVGGLGIVGIFFLLNHTSYYFIKDVNNLQERNSVGFKLHLTVLIVGFIVGMTISAMSPFEELSLLIGFLYNMVWIPFFWAFMFTGVMKVLPPKNSRYLYPLPKEPNYMLIVIGVVLILIDIFVFGPGLFFA
ncbi:MAG: hypothetical protein K6E91_08995 [Butyrivibrio sp.]|nr:hypothetical protein [Butyrivibrio sp.]